MADEIKDPNKKPQGGDQKPGEQSKEQPKKDDSKKNDAPATTPEK